MNDETGEAERLDDRATRVLDRLGEDGEAEPPEPADDKEEEAVAPPASWPDEEKASFSALPRPLQAAIARREGERERAVDEERRAYAERLDRLIAAAQAAPDAAEDWAKLAREDPAGFAQRVAAMQQRAQHLAAAQQERHRLAEERNRDYLARELRHLTQKAPELRDPGQRQALLGELGGYLAEAGFSPEELGGVADHRTYLVALDAMRYRKLMKAQKEAAKKRAAAPKVQKPGAAGEAEEGAGTRLAALKKAARRSGRLDDRAAFVLAALRD